MIASTPAIGAAEASSSALGIGRSALPGGAIPSAAQPSRNCHDTSPCWSTPTRRRVPPTALSREPPAHQASGALLFASVMLAAVWSRRLSGGRQGA